MERHCHLRQPLPPGIVEQQIRGIALTTVIAVKPSVAAPEISELLVRACAVAELVRERAQQTEADRRVSEEVVARLREADLLRVMQPRAYGGYECGFEV